MENHTAGTILGNQPRKTQINISNETKKMNIVFEIYPT